MKFFSDESRSVYRGIVRRGQVVLPPGFSTFRLGERVYFHLRGHEIVVQKTPKRAVSGRLLSSRIRRGVRTLAAYGPRSLDVSTGSR